jgi:transcriptional regulator with XRE-family HTH domain
LILATAPYLQLPDDLRKERQMSFGRALRIVRAFKNLSQQELAARVGLDPSYVSLLERDLRTPRSRTMEMVADKLGLPVSLLQLLAADERELRGVTAQEAQHLGEQLLTILERETAPTLFPTD